MSKAAIIKQEVIRLGDQRIAEHSQRFFKTGKGEYGEGDKFLGIRVPVLRTVSKKYKTLPLTQLRLLIQSEYHEIRLVAVYILVLQFKRAKKNIDRQKEICDFYLANMNYINNWDLVDSSAHYMLGPYLLNREKGLLYKLSKSDNLWHRRIGIMTTFHFIKNNQFDETLAIAEILLKDDHDLIHKAVGWMLREIGKRDKKTEEQFLLNHYKKMPRTMLRYAIEKFPKEERKAYLKGLK